MELQRVFTLGDGCWLPTEVLADAFGRGDKHAMRSRTLGDRIGGETCESEFVPAGREKQRGGGKLRGGEKHIIKPIPKSVVF